MKVVFDGTPFLLEKTGIGHYTENLVAYLINSRPEEQYYMFCISLRGGHRLKSVSPPLEGVEVKGYNLPANFLYYTWWRRTSLLPVESFLGEFDIFHATNYQAPALRHARLVSTVHDINFVRFPEMQSKGIRRFISSLPRLLERSRMVLADSRFTADELGEVYDLPAEKLKVVYPGLDPVFLAEPIEEEMETALRAYALTPPYLAYIGNLHPRKNLATLLEAFSLLRARGLEHRLAVIGGGGLGRLNNTEYRKLMLRVQDLGLEEQVTFTGYVPDERLRSLLAKADMLVFPSIYEGFGLPPLEAMACGVPVITSRRASLPEVVGDAALLLDNPLEAEEIAAAVEKLIADPALRSRMVRKGRERARAFTWENAASEVLEVYDRVMEGD
ncbi:MAG: glycosyltransferase family 1 protein [Actinobacteria bacterium]|jgi:glycosyltransferase involved in cell wall biosynthesis|nr:MAG: glycosyltransferase family 1 protein [Actinomycetota bacterium]